LVTVRRDATSGLLHRRLVSALGFLLLIVSVEDSPSGTGYRTGEHPLQWGCLRTSLRGGAVLPSSVMLGRLCLFRLVVVYDGEIHAKTKILCCRIRHIRIIRLWR
jgi:hypothetical protein